MTSILTNNSAMVALQTLKSVNAGLSKTQSEISTGKSVGSARDNAAVWAISKVMESDVKGFKGIAEALSLGDSTVTVARTAAESVTDLLTQMKGKIVSAQQDNVDRGKIQADIDQLRGQIDSIVGTAQFNGLNLVNGTAGATSNVLSSLDRASDGTVQSGQISVDLSGTNLSRAAGTAVTAFTAPTDMIANEASATPVVIAATAFAFADGAGATGGASARRPDDMTAAPAANALAAGDRIGMDVGGVKVSYDIREGDTGAAILGGLRGALEEAGLSGDLTVAFDGASLTITNTKPVNAVPGTDDVTVAVTATRGAGGLSSLNGMTVAGTDTQRTDALRDIETMIQYSIDAAATFGSAQGRIDTQSQFVSKLMDAMKSGIGTLVDANLEEASARLQALQVQQQLATQSLSIANQAPQNILALFR